MTDFVTIAHYDDFLTANFDKQKLEVRGIPCYLADENTVTIKWILKNAIGGIKLRVPEKFVDEAIRILSEKTETLEVDYQLEKGKDNPSCPNCGSNNTATEKYSRSIAGWTWLILGFPVKARLVKEYRCFYCGHRWKSGQ